MAKLARVSTKRLLIDRANSTIVIAVGIAAFISAFSLVSCRSLLARRSYQAKVIAEQEKARDQLTKNVEAVDDLKASYESFVSRTENIIAGSSTGTGERDGDNAKIVLDALPSKYDFPALATSLEKILDDRNYIIQSISGTDEEANQTASGQATAQGTATNSQAQTTTTAQPQSSGQAPGESNATAMPFEVSAKGQYASLIDLIKIFQYSIRPLHVQKIVFLANDDGTVSLTVTGESYYQAEKTLNITEEVVK
jgi:hypothetical protein